MGLKEKMRMHHKFRAAILALMAFIIAITLYLTVSTARDISYPLDNSEMEKWEENWFYYENDQKVYVESMPSEINVSGGEGLTIYHELPEIQSDKVVVLSNKYQEITASVEDKMIFQYESRPIAKNKMMLGNTYCLIKVVPENSGKLLSIHINNFYSAGEIHISDIYFTTESDVVAHLWQEEGGRFIYCVVLGVIGLVLISSGLLFGILKGINVKSVYSACLFIVLSALWLYTDSKISILWNLEPAVVCLISFYSFFLMPYPLFVFLENICHRQSKLLKTAKVLVITNFLTQNILYFCGIMSFPQLLTVTHGIVGISVICCFTYMLRELKHKHSFYARIFFGGSTALFIMSVIALISFRNGNNHYYSTCYQIGLLIFIVSLISMALYQIRNNAYESGRARIYKQLAYMDYMTKFRNRSAYEDKIQKLRESYPNGKTLNVILMDINGLKFTNDTKGHAFGDKLIKAGAYCIREAYKNLGNIYRIGGDEFIVLIDNEKGDKDYKGLLQTVIEHHNMSHELQVSIAVGCACGVRTDTDGKWLREIIEQADKSMYKDKNESKMLA